MLRGVGRSRQDGCRSCLRSSRSLSSVQGALAQGSNAVLSVRRQVI
jgi:hypothetical protein